VKRALLLGSSSGIGLATTRALLVEGWTVTGVARSPSPVEHARHEHVALDLTSPNLRATLEELVARRGPFDACLWCAGIGEPLDLARLNQDLRVFEVNLLAAVVAAGVLLPEMVQAGAGHFLVLSSLSDELVSAEAPSYAASKAALSSYFEGLALALRPSGVAVTNVRFGFVDTRMAKAAVRPFLISPETAATVILRALERRPLRISYPRRMAILVRLLAWATRLRIAWARTPAR
jgi:NAD(P)-dependent dehydrogenase (short-subunit alcohol dehydrogenase family)